MCDARHTVTVQVYFYTIYVVVYAQNMWLNFRSIAPTYIYLTIIIDIAGVYLLRHDQILENDRLYKILKSDQQIKNNTIK